MMINSYKSQVEVRISIWIYDVPESHRLVLISQFSLKNNNSKNKANYLQLQCRQEKNK